ncbi:hypothetical protein LINPERPRIM_LOCUS33506 [Linum perenne]
MVQAQVKLHHQRRNAHALHPKERRFMLVSQEDSYKKRQSQLRSRQRGTCTWRCFYHYHVLLLSI